MTCVLDEMDLIILKDKTKKLEMIKIGIEQEYEHFKNQTNIKELFKQRKIYDLEMTKKQDTYKFKQTHDNDGKDVIIPIELDNDYEKILKNCTNIINVRKLQNILINRLEYLSNNIKNITKSVIEKSRLTDIYTGLPESSCCSEDADKFLNYYFYIITESTEPVQQNIKESVLIYDYLKYFVNIGSIHKSILYDETAYAGIHNNVIVDDEKNTSQSVIKSVFEVFVDSGIHSGTLREYVSIINDQLDVKSGLTKTQILSKTYTNEEYKVLLHNIEKHNIKYYKKSEKINFDKDELNELKKTSDDKIDNEINILVKNMANILNKDKKFIQKYVDLLHNFGVFDKDEDLKTDKLKIKNRDLINKKKLDYIKKFYVTKLRKYLSIIQNSQEQSINNIDLSFSESESILLEIQTIIFEDNQKLLPFLNEEVRKYFLNLTINYSNDEINSINIFDNIYDSKYEKIKVYSNFNFNDASNVVLYILIKQLNNFIICKTDDKVDSTISEKNYDSENIYKNNNNNINCKHICNFIMILFNELENDYELFNLCNKGAEGIKNSIKHDEIEYKYKQYIKGDDNYTEKMMQSKLSKKKPNYLDDPLQEEQDEIIENDLYQEKIDFIMDKGKKVLLKKHGHDATEDELESYKTDYLKNIEDDKMYEEEIYDFDNAPKGKEVIDMGAGYGEFNEYDFENGDGFDYTEKEEDFE